MTEKQERNASSVEEVSQLLKTEKLGKLVSKTSFKIGLGVALVMRTFVGFVVAILIWTDICYILDPPSQEWYWHLFIIFFLPFLHFVAVPPFILQDFGYREISIYEKGIGFPLLTGEATAWIEKRKLEWVVPLEFITKIQKVYVLTNGKRQLKKICLFFPGLKGEKIFKKNFKPSQGEELLSLIKPLMGERFDEIMEEKVIEK